VTGSWTSCSRGEHCGNTVSRLFLNRKMGPCSRRSFRVVPNIGCCGAGEISLADFNHDGKLMLGLQITDHISYYDSDVPSATMIRRPSFASQAVARQIEARQSRLQPAAISHQQLALRISDTAFAWATRCPRHTYCGFTVTFSPVTTGVRTGQ